MKTSALKRYFKSNEKKATDWEEIFKMHMLGKGFVSSAYK